MKISIDNKSAFFRLSFGVNCHILAFGVKRAKSGGQTFNTYQNELPSLIFVICNQKIIN
jgi:hypothetical protein